MPTARIDESIIKSKIIYRLIFCEDELAKNHVDRFHVPRRRRKSHLKHLGTEYFSYADTESLVQYYKHLIGKMVKAGLLKEVDDA